MSLIVVEDDSSDERASVSEDEQSKDVSDNRFNNKPSARELTMDERSYDDAETISTPDNNDDEEKPLLELMKHLINYNGKQNTKLTNSQLVGILKKEFNLDPARLHFISVEIYMNVLKKFLKDWPQWDEFDQVMHETRCMDDHEEVEKMLDIEYTSLKTYLSTILKATEPFAREETQKLKRSEEIPETSKSVPGDVVLEINCTRDQLNKLFFRKPHPEYKDSIFNIAPHLPSKIYIHQQNFQSMLNSCYVNISINMDYFKYKREMLANFKHKLVNKSLRQIQREPKLNTHLQTLKLSKGQTDVARKDLKFVIEKIQRSNRYGIEQQHDVDTLFRTVIEDLSVLPATYNNGRVETPSIFRHYLSRFPFVRHLCQDVDGESEKYDLQLEEKISPMLCFHINRCNVIGKTINTDSNWLKLECSICQIKYHGVQGIEALKTHFRECHQNEQNWVCTHCDKEFVAAQLATARWHHRCENN
ncbi:uncharacterized protein LOC125239977 [Leguminivora glycinivorella]|uniref:uncharacterized protein LOC125239977 n=1 Tax=Leguminivora glycinivorella TaxID=1035111 RepID=UPI00200CD2CA|nr:uncharacterized protein LOC125239977 [Leguminivora glycinivorella]